VIDATTKRPLHVSTDGTAGPYIMLPVSQLTEVRQLLDSHGIRYWIEEDFISLNGAPEDAVIDLGHEANTGAVQAILDGVRKVVHNIQYEIILYWSRDDQAFIAEVPELAGCAADGATYQEAVANAEVVVREWIETARELGRPVPEPRGRLMYA
jgi:predicted RNase H-like HicB family nuclease